jgi:hypothetical protein
LKAAIASDLTAALSFYRRNGFEQSIQRSGGAARGRSILVHVRQLDTPSLFSPIANDVTERPWPRLDFAAGHTTSAVPLYAIDLNVLFDLTKNRARSSDARKLFGAALSHKFRLAVAPEFIAELERTGADKDADPILQMALQLPRLPSSSKAELDALADRIHELVFVEPGLSSAGSVQSMSDARHLAHSALSRAAGYITSDKALLSARPRLLETVGIDVASCDDLISLVPKVDVRAWQAPRGGAGFVCTQPEAADVRAYLVEHHVPNNLVEEFAPADRRPENAVYWGISCGTELRAIAAVRIGSAIGAPTRLLVHVRPDNPDADLYADHLLDVAIRAISRSDPAAIELADVPGQTPTKSAAAARGFMAARGRDLTKLAVGRPITRSNWSSIMEQLRRKTGVTFPPTYPTGLADDTMLLAKDPAGGAFRINAGTLEHLLDPTVILWSGRNGVIVPIRRSFADELLGTSSQLEFSIVERREASFRSKRAYVNTPRAAAKMRPNVPVLFYESGREGGRSAVIAVARIVDSLVTRKKEISDDSARRIATEHVDQFSSGEDVLLTTFESVMPLPRPCPLEELRKMSATGTQNLLTATDVSSANLARIVSMGWNE